MGDAHAAHHVRVQHRSASQSSRFSLSFNVHWTINQHLEETPEKCTYQVVAAVVTPTFHTASPTPLSSLGTPSNDSTLPESISTFVITSTPSDCSRVGVSIGLAWNTSRIADCERPCWRIGALDAYVVRPAELPLPRNCESGRAASRALSATRITMKENTNACVRAIGVRTASG